MRKAATTSHTSSPTSVFIVACLLLAALKIILVGGEEIVARNQPYDDLWQILAAGRGYWLGSDYNHLMFVHLPVYPLWVAGVHITGIPLRLATELLYLFAAFLFSLSLLRARVGRVAALAVFAAAAFHPATFRLFDYALTDMLYAPLFLLALASLVMVWTKRGEKGSGWYALLLGFVCSLLWNLRKENPLLFGLFLLVAVLATFTSRREGVSWRGVTRRIGVMAVLPLLMALLSSVVVKGLNHHRFGLFVSTEMTAPGYTAAYRALLRIKPTRSIRFIPVTREVRQAAYRESPAFRELEPFFEGDFGRVVALETAKYMHISDEIAAGWFYWSLRDAAALAGHHKSAVEAEAYYRRIADEINGAIDAGRLPGRPVLAAFLDPDPNNYLPYLPGSFLKISRMFAAGRDEARESDSDLPAVRRAFDIIANRRTAPSSYRVATLEGSLAPSGEPMERVLVKTRNGEILGGGPLLPADGGTSPSARFAVSVAQAAADLAQARLVFAGRGGEEFSFPYGEVVAGRPFQALGADGRTVRATVETVSLPKPLAFRERLQTLLWSLHGTMITYLSWAGVAAIVVLLFCRRRVDLREPVYPLLALFLFAVVSRVALFSLIDASSWPGDQPRYLFPVMPVYSAFLLLLIGQAVRVAVPRRLRGRS